MEEEKAQVTEQEATPEPEQPEAPEEEATLEAEQLTKTTPEPTPEIPQAGVSSDEAKEQLAQEVKACVIEGKNCRGLGDKFDEVARKLGVPVDELIDGVFELAKAEEGQSLYKIH